MTVHRDAVKIHEVTAFKRSMLYMPFTLILYAPSLHHSAIRYS